MRPHKNMNKILCLKCVRCGKAHGMEDIRYVCPSCNGNLQVVYDYGKIRKKLTRAFLKNNKDFSIRRYADILPVEKTESLPELQIGWTPMYRAQNLEKDSGISKIYVKDDGRNPSASFKDRAGAVALARALEADEEVIASASTGNAASSLACLASYKDIQTVIFVPETAPTAKVAQLLVFGATVISVRGTYDDAFDLCVKASEEYGWYNRNTGFNPFTREGKKTCAFEICEQLDWKVPDWVFVPVGDGNIISGIWKGFTDFKKLGLISKLPRLWAVQAEKSDSVYRAWKSGGEIKPVSGETVADSISVSLPRDGLAAVKAVLESKGLALTVKDDEILSAIPALARATGVFAEPAAAASYAGFKKAVHSGLIRKMETVVLLVTGNGLKDVQSAMKSVGKPYSIRPSLEDLKKLVETKNFGRN